MTDIQTKDGDIYIDAHGMSYLVSGIAEIIQRNEQHFALFRGEWFLDLDAGVPYREEILGKGRSLGQIEAVFKAEILKIPGNRALLSLNLEIDPQSRRLLATYSVFAADIDVPVKVEVSI